jgi:hypothetical protein
MSKFVSRCAAVAVVALIPLAAWAGCRSEYQDEIVSCQMLHDGPDEAEDLQLCIEAAKDDYDSCVD